MTVRINKSRLDGRWPSGVTRVGDTRGGNWGCHPSIFSWKTWRPFLGSACVVIPGFFSLLLNTWRPFFCSSLSLSLLLFIAFTRVSPPPGCHPTPFLYVRPRFSTIRCKFAHKNFFLRVSPPGGCHRGRSALPPPLPLVTPLRWPALNMQLIFIQGFANINNVTLMLLLLIHKFNILI